MSAGAHIRGVGILAVRVGGKTANTAPLLWSEHILYNNLTPEIEK